MSSPAKDRPIADNASQVTRLDSWKEIAAYLGKVERTVKRWEMDRGLPIHRVPGRGRSSVFAYTSELDAWMDSRKALELVPIHDDAEEAAPGQFPIRAASAKAGSAVATSPAREPHASRPVLSRNWLLALCGLLLAGVVSTALYTLVARRTGLRLSAALPFLLTWSAPNSDRPASSAVSDSEKNQAQGLYLKGRYEWNQRTPDSLNRALDDFTQAIVHNPGYAEAYVGMADTYDLLREYSTMSDRDAYARASAAARKAVELDDSLAEAHRALAFTEWWGEWDFVDGEKEFRRAIELNPKDPLARKWYANVLSVQARFSEGLEQIDKAQELDPSSHSILADKGLLLFNAGRREEGIELLKEVERDEPEFRSPHDYLMTIALQSRNYPSYLEEGKKIAAAGNDSVLADIIASAGAGYERGGERGFLSHLYASQSKYYSEGKLWGPSLAETAAMMGHKQEALQLLEGAYDRHEWGVLVCLTNLNMLTLKDEPGYKALIEKINFPGRPQNMQPSASPAGNQPPLRAASDPHLSPAGCAMQGPPQRNQHSSESQPMRPAERKLRDLPSSAGVCSCTDTILSAVRAGRDT